MLLYPSKNYKTVELKFCRDLMFSATNILNRETEGAYKEVGKGEKDNCRVKGRLLKVRNSTRSKPFLRRGDIGCGLSKGMSQLGCSS